MNDFFSIACYNHKREHVDSKPTIQWCFLIDCFLVCKKPQTIKNNK